MVRNNFDFYRMKSEFLSSVFKQWAVFFLVLTLFTSCKKDPGKGGTASIQGKVWVRQYDSFFSTLDFSYWAQDENVYIIYGDNLGYSDNTSTDFEGNFFFPNLYKGSYRIFTYSSDSSKILGPPLNLHAPDSAVVADVELTANKQTYDLGTLTILKNK